MQHPYTYSKWDSIHEPHNIVENALVDNELLYKGLTPDFDLNLSNNNSCFVSEVLIWPGDTGPNQVEIYVADYMDGWAFVKSFTCPKFGVARLELPGDYEAKYLRVRCLNNTRGGNIVNVRYISVRGLKL